MKRFQADHNTCIVTLFFLSTACVPELQPRTDADDQDTTPAAPNTPEAPRDPVDPDAPNSPPPPNEGDEIVGNNQVVIWKRYRAVEKDLSRALEIPTNQLCTELDSLNCINEVHLSNLGGHNPIMQGRLTSLAEPALTTPLSIDRVVLMACIQRVDQDSASPPTIFTQYPLGRDTNGSAQDITQLDAQNRTLYQRLLSRDPTDEELVELRELAVPGTSFRDVAIGSCYSIGTSVEFIFL
ncbi:MAG: hypothetical protein KTR25_05705 [Myxococcales bacterium]|nr:hypothetical protein [Myxococcales bacterium]